MAELVTQRPPASDRHPAVRRIDWGRIAGYVILTSGALLAMVPFLIMFSTSLMNLTEASSAQFLPSTPRWSNYLEAWNEANFSDYFINSIIITAITLTGELVFCTLAAYAFARMEFPGKNTLYVLILATLMLPEAVTWVPNFITVSWIGRFSPIPWLDNWPALTIPFMASAFSILILRQFFQQIPDELWDSAQIDGAGHIRYLWQIVLPLSRAPLVTVALFGFIGSWNALAWPILVTTSETWRPIAYGLYSFIEEENTRIHLQMAGSVITAIPIIIVYFFTQKQFTEGISRSGLKG